MGFKVLNSRWVLYRFVALLFWAVVYLDDFKLSSCLFYLYVIVLVWDKHAQANAT